MYARACTFCGRDITAFSRRPRRHCTYLTAHKAGCCTDDSSPFISSLCLRLLHIDIAGCSLCISPLVDAFVASCDGFPRWHGSRRRSFYVLTFSVKRRCRLCFILLHSGAISNGDRRGHPRCHGLLTISTFHTDAVDLGRIEDHTGKSGEQMALHETGPTAAALPPSGTTSFGYLHLDTDPHRAGRDAVMTETHHERSLPFSANQPTFWTRNKGELTRWL
ncbi:hypothetical protein BKA93DRAFT_416214 [Sparassis latifolia]